MFLLSQFMIFDCITYSSNYEDLILEIRLNTLDKFVDKFVIVEATLDHSGRKKKLNFNINKFKKFKHKIRYIVVEDMPKYTKSFYFNRRKWHRNIVRDEYQRNQILRGLHDAKDEDIILISDCDEIPNLNQLKKTKIKKYAVFNQKFYKYKLNLFSPKQTPYQGSRVIKAKYLKNNRTPQWLRYQYTKKIKFWQIHRFFTNPQVINNGGWHFSFALNPKNISLKLKSYAHGELNKKKFTNVNYINNRINSHKDLFSEDKLIKVKINKSFPDYIIKNIKKFKDIIL
jgi:beta-1,4-mannosyl-glycoprotein beta-1,4-N-acetylglucosaminyltransferase